MNELQETPESIIGFWFGDEEDDAAQVRLEFLLAAEKRFPWDRANRAAFTYNACSKCYVVCHPERMKKKAGESD